MGKIVLLDDLTINQIAAGEVIERPASAIKEMLENSIDAGAKNITVEIKNGGISLIRITDDGSGIAPDDMEMSFERHATSKIRKAEDLAVVETMGFRGEALASIAAISKLEIVSRTAYDDIGQQIVVEGGKLISKEEVATQKGTRITVQNLFYNTPVRYKFLKKDYTEAGYIETVVTRIALVNKYVAIKLISNGKVLLQTNGSGDFKDILYGIYGKDVSGGVVDIDYTYEDMKVTGVIGKTEIARSNRSNQMFFVNNRYIKDPKLSAAIEQAYKGLLPTGKYAFAILNIKMDPKKVDVNVHPAKLEVRFQDDSEVFKAVYNAIKSGIASVTMKSDEKIEFNEAESEEKVILDEKKEEPKQELEEEIDEVEEVKTPRPSIANLLKKFVKDNKEEQEEKEEPEKAEEPEEIKVAEKEEAPLEDIVQNVVEEIKPEAREIGKHEMVEEMQEEKIEEPVSNESVEKQEEEKTPAIANEDIIEKEIKIGDTKISSNTRTLDFNISEAVKEETRSIDSTKKIEIQETQIIPATKPAVAPQETQVVNINKELKQEEKEEPENQEKVEEQEEIKIAEKEEAPQETAKVNMQEVMQESKIEEKVESTVPSIEAVENITSRILELKMNNMNNTQMIDTVKVREAMEEINEVTPEFANMYKKTFGVDANVIRKEREEEKQEREKINVSKDFVNAENSTIFENEEVVPARVNYKLIGTAFSTNIIIELNNEMYIIDQNSAFFRLTYEAVKAIYYSENDKDSQSLLLPDIITVTFREMSLARENVDLFARAGFAFEEFGENTIKLTAVPTFCEDLNTKQLFINVLNEIDRVLLNDKEEKENKFIIAVAKNAAAKVRRTLDEKEIDDLLQKLLVLDNPFEVIGDTVTAIKMSRADIEKKFSRRK